MWEASLTQEDSKKIKGIAIIMMMFHHLYAYPAWWKFEYSLPICKWISIDKIAILGEVMKICIPIYAFLSGYGFFLSFRGKGARELLSKTRTKILKILINYWIILFPIAVIVFLWQRGVWDLKRVICNLFGFGELLMPFAWYIGFYLITLSSYSCVYLIISRIEYFKLKLYVGIAYIVLCRIGYYWLSADHQRMLPTIISQILIYSPYIVLGSICAAIKLKLDMSDCIIKLKYRNTVHFFAIIGCLIVKILLKGSTVLDILLVPVLIYGFLYMIKTINSVKIDKILIFLGNHSFNLWMLHGICFVWKFPFYKELQTIIYFPRLIIAILIWYIILMLPFSSCVSECNKRIVKKLNI